MNEGWKCPVCNRGVRPDKDTCDHGGGPVLGPLNPAINPFQPVNVPSPNVPPWGPSWGNGEIVCGPTMAVATYSGTDPRH